MKQTLLLALLTISTLFTEAQGTTTICTNTYTVIGDHLLDSLTILPDSTMIDWDIFINGGAQIFEGFFSPDYSYNQGYFNWMNPPLRVFNPPLALSNGDVITQVIHTATGTTTGCAVFSFPSDTTGDTTTIVTTPTTICTNSYTFTGDFLLDSLTILPDSTMIDWDIFINGGAQIFEGFFSPDYSYNQGYFDWMNPPLRVFSPPLSISTGDVLTQVIHTATGTTTGCAVLNLAPITINHNCNALYALSPDPVNPHQWWALNQAAGTGSISYTWFWGDGASSTGATPSHTYSASGHYNICLTISDSAGCTDTYCDSSTYIYKTEQAAITVTCVSQLPTGISETPNNAQVSIYPNPVDKQLFIETSGAGSEQINIYSSTGVLVYQARLVQNRAIDVSQFAKDVYVVEIKNKETSVRKLLVKM